MAPKPAAVAAAVERPSELLSRNQLLEMFYYARLTRDVEDRLAILESVARTSRALVLHEASRTGGIGGEIAACIAEEGFEYLDAPVTRLASLDTPVPCSSPLEHAFMPGVDTVVDAVRRLVRY